MTITYQKNVSNTSFMGFAKLLFIWKGSIYKLVFRELIMYGSAFSIISICYRFLMTDEQKRKFEQVALYCDQTSGLLPMSFVLGFYVTFVVSRWWNQFTNLPWPDRLAHTVLMYVNGSQERSRIIRRTLVRYVNLATIILFQGISGAVKKRFPTLRHIIEAGLMTPEEMQMYEAVDLKVNKHWVPFTWFINLINLARKENKIDSDEAVKQILDELNKVRSRTGLLWGHDWVTVPLVYTQVVTLLTHLFFLTCLIGRQFLDPEQGYKGHDVDLYFPVYTFLQFFFFLGWLKVAEQLINPFGEDDDDFEINWFIDRNVQVSYAIVDYGYGKLAKLERDPHWGTHSIDLPYTEASKIHKIPNYKGSTMDVVVSPREQVMVHYDLSPPPEQEQPNSNYWYHLQYLASRYCCVCCQRGAPPMNKPLGESYGRTEPLSFEQYDNPNHRKTSTYSIFGGDYFNLINRSSKRDSLGYNHVNHDVVITNLPSNGLKTKRKLSTASEPGDLALPAEATSLAPPTNNYLRRQRPSTVVAQVLASVCENDKEESDSGSSGTPSPPESVKISMAFLDEDLNDIVSIK